MPELPDLEAIKDVLIRRIVGHRIRYASVERPTVVRTLVSHATPETFLVGRSVETISLRGKFLLFDLGSSRWIVFNFMLSGNLRFCSPRDQIRKRDYLVLGLGDDSELRYHDPHGMGKVYLTEDLAQVPGYAGMGPDALDSALTEEAFLARLRSYRGEIKGVLTRGSCVAGIGNAYADEILYAAGIYPFRKRTSLSQEEQRALYRAMRKVLTEAVGIVRGRMGDRIDLKIRDFLLVHNKRGEPCPRCGQTISEVKVRRRATSFCRKCQPGSLLIR